MVLLALAVSALLGLETENFILVVIDGARYTETFGDPNHTYVPRMYELSQYGALIDSFYNDSFTYTSRAIPAIWCGAWTELRDTFDMEGHETHYTVLPTFFEYYRKQKGMPADSVYYVLKYVHSLWQMSYHPDYGPDYWPTYHSEGTSDIDVWEEAEFILETRHPRLMMLYLAETDHAGHTGNWNYYTNCIKTADSIVGLLWEKIQSDPFYCNKTSIIITNDHGRHDDQHGGFQGHGCGCEGCRHIMFLALGPDFKQGYISYIRRRIPDIVPTIGYLMGFYPEYSTGEVIEEIFASTEVSEKIEPTIDADIYPSITHDAVVFNSRDSKFVRISIYNIAGSLVGQISGHTPLRWKTDNILPGIYLYKTDRGQKSKLLIIK